MCTNLAFDAFIGHEFILCIFYYKIILFYLLRFFRKAIITLFRKKKAYLLLNFIYDTEIYVMAFFIDHL